MFWSSVTDVAWPLGAGLDPSRLILNGTSCPKAAILAVNRQDWMAKIQCDCKTGGPECTPVWVNLDVLSCNPSNVTTYARGALAAACSPDSLALAAPILTAQTIVEEVSKKFGEDVLTRAEARFNEVRQNVKIDQTFLVAKYVQMGPVKALQALRASGARLEDRWKYLSARYGSDCNKSPTRDGIADTIGQDGCRLVGEAAKLFADLQSRPELFSDADPEAAWTAWLALLAPTTPEGEKAANREWASLRENNPDARKNSREQLELVTALQPGAAVGGPLGVPYSALVLRMILLQGLPVSDQLASAKKPLNYAHISKDGGGPFVDLYNGYLFGGRAEGRGYDCSDLITSILGPEARGLLSTSSFTQIAVALEGRVKSPLAPNLVDWAACFRTVNLRSGESPLPGDIVVSRNEGVRHEGHIVLVEGYEAATRQVATVEATGGYENTVGHFRRPLFEAACRYEGPTPDWQMRPARPDLHVLRFELKAGCPLQDL